MGLETLLENQLGHMANVPEVAHTLSFYPKGRSRVYFSSMGIGFWDTGRFSKLPYLGMKPAIDQSSRSCTYTLSTPGGGVETELIFALWAAVSEIRANFQNSYIWAWNLASGRSFQKLHICSLSTPGGRNWAYFCSRGSGFWDTGQFSNLPYLRMKLGKWPKFHNLHIHSLSTPGGGGEIELIFTLWAAVYETPADFQNCHIWAWHLASGQSSRSCTYTLLLPHRVEIELTFALRAAVSEIRANSQKCHIWAWNLPIGQSARSCTYIT